MGSRRAVILGMLGSAVCLSSCNAFTQVGYRPSPRKQHGILVFQPKVSLSQRVLGGEYILDSRLNLKLEPIIKHEAVKVLKQQGYSVKVYTPNTLDSQAYSLVNLNSVMAQAILNYDLNGNKIRSLPTRGEALNIGDTGQTFANAFNVNLGFFISLTGSQAIGFQRLGEYIAKNTFNVDLAFPPRRIIASCIDLRSGDMVWVRAMVSNDFNRPQHVRRAVKRLITATNILQARLYRHHLSARV